MQLYNDLLDDVYTLIEYNFDILCLFQLDTKNIWP
jgi:hypothetical protein